MRLLALEWMSLDGVVQSPSYPDEDPSGGFVHGGWHPRYLDEEAGAWLVENVQSADAYLLGRGTYDIFAAHWPTAGPEHTPPALAVPLNERPKYVVTSRDLGDEAWANSTRVAGPADEAVAALKAAGPGTLALIGSPGLAASLFAADLVDELRVMIDPIVLGSGKRLFGAHPDRVGFELASVAAVTTGAILATYLRARDRVSTR